MKKIGPGSSFFSLLSMLDILMGVPSMFKTVSLRALEPCTVAKFPIRTFRDSYQKLPEVWIRPIQIVITRLLHVTMTTLHQYMGLSSELMKRVGGFKCLKLLFFVFKGSLFKFFFFVVIFGEKFELPETRRNPNGGASATFVRSTASAKSDRRATQVKGQKRQHRRVQRYVGGELEFCIFKIFRKSHLSSKNDLFFYMIFFQKFRISKLFQDIKSDAPLTQEQKTLAAKWFGEALGLQHVDSVDLLSEYVSLA